MDNFVQIFLKIFLDIGNVKNIFLIFNIYIISHNFISYNYIFMLPVIKKWLHAISFTNEELEWNIYYKKTSHETTVKT